MIRRTESGRQITKVNLGKKLAAPVVQSTSGTSAIHEEIVPAGKKWVLRHVHFNRDQAADVDIQIIDPSANGIKVAQFTAATSGDYVPATEFTLYPGWSVKTNFSSGVSGWCDSWVLYDEGDI